MVFLLLMGSDGFVRCMNSVKENQPEDSDLGFTEITGLRRTGTLTVK